MCVELERKNISNYLCGSDFIFRRKVSLISQNACFCNTNFGHKRLHTNNAETGETGDTEVVNQSRIVDTNMRGIIFQW